MCVSCFMATIHTLNLDGHYGHHERLEGAVAKHKHRCTHTRVRGEFFSLYFYTDGELCSELRV